MRAFDEVGAAYFVPSRLSPQPFTLSPQPFALSPQPFALSLSKRSAGLRQAQPERGGESSNRLIQR